MYAKAPAKKAPTIQENNIGRPIPPKKPVVAGLTASIDTVFNKEMLQKGKLGLFFKKEIFSITKKIDYCEKEKLEIDKFRLESIKGITKKYNWDFVTIQYLEIFKSLISKRN